MTYALRIDVDGEVTDVELPDDPAAQRTALSDHVRGDAEAAYYHRSTVLHLNDDGDGDGLPNIVSWTLACAWRRMNLGADYVLHGPLVVTGADGDDGLVLPLPDEFAAQVRTAAAIVRETVHAWQGRSPVSAEVALKEVLAYVRRDLASA